MERYARNIVVASISVEKVNLCIVEDNKIRSNTKWTESESKKREGFQARRNLA